MYTSEQKLEYSHLLVEAYQVFGQRAENVAGWRRLDDALASDRGQNNTGLKFQVYEKNGQYVMAIAGTDPEASIEGFRDLVADAGLFFRTYAEQFHDAIAAVDNFLDARSDINRADITFVGHSLGGAHAQILAETFGSQAFTFDAPGVKGVLDSDVLTENALGINYANTLAELGITPAPSGAIYAENYYEQGSIISAGGIYFSTDEYIGNTFAVDYASDALPNLALAIQGVGLASLNFKLFLLGTTLALTDVALPGGSHDKNNIIAALEQEVFGDAELEPLLFVLKDLAKTRDFDSQQNPGVSFETLIQTVKNAVDAGQISTLKEMEDFFKIEVAFLDGYEKLLETRDSFRERLDASLSRISENVEFIPDGASILAEATVINERQTAKLAELFQRYFEAVNDLQNQDLSLAQVEAGIDSELVNFEYDAFAHLGTGYSEGTSQSDVLVSTGGETLYGGGGDDILIASDFGSTLYGDIVGDFDFFEAANPGNDTLIGGSGDDEFYGGLGDDTLIGSFGDDYYYYVTGDGKDTIIDKDGSIIFDGTRVTGGEFDSQLNRYVSNDSQFTYQFVEGDLVINNELTIAGFENGDLGINLHTPSVETSFFGGTGEQWQSGRDIFVGMNLPWSNVGGRHIITQQYPRELTSQSGFEELSASRGGATGTYHDSELLIDAVNNRIEVPGLVTNYRFEIEYQIVHDSGDVETGEIEAGSHNWGSGQQQLYQWSDGFQAYVITGTRYAHFEGTMLTMTTVSTHSYFEEGNDHLSGTEQNDIIAGMGGNDTLLGNGGDDYIIASSGYNGYTATGSLFIDGGEGNDYIDARTNSLNNTNGYITGGAGNDLLEVYADGKTHVSGGEGNDIVKIKRRSGEHIYDYEGGFDLIELSADNFGHNFVANGSLTINFEHEESRYEFYIVQNVFTGDTTSPEQLVIVDKEYVPGDLVFIKDIVTGEGLYLDTGISFDGWNRFEDSYAYSLSFSDNTLGFEDIERKISESRENSTGGADTIIGDGSNDFLLGEDGDDIIDGGRGIDLLDGGAGDDVLDGGDGNDEIYGGLGNDAITGGQGNDRLRGGEGSDTYQFNIGDGFDAIEEAEDTAVSPSGAGQAPLNALLWSLENEDFVRGLDGRSSINQRHNIFRVIHASEATSDSPIDNDVIEFGEGITFNSLQFKKSNNSLLIFVGDQGEGIEIKDWLSKGIEEFRFADGTSLSLEDINDIVSQTGSDNDDVLEGTDSDNKMVGHAGDDRLNAGAGNDILSGGQGNDVLYGEGGDDIYFFEKGHGSDQIIDSTNGGQSNTILFGDSVNKETVNFIRLNNDLRISFSDSSDSILVSDWFKQDTNGAFSRSILQIEFADGTSYSVDDIYVQMGISPPAPQFVGDAQDNEIHGSDGDDIIRAGAGDDTIDGGAGDDLLLGEEGSDTYLFRYGSGQDRISEIITNVGDLNGVVFGEGINANNIQFERFGSLGLLIRLDESQDSLRIDNWFAEPGSDEFNQTLPVEKFQFSDGSELAIEDIALYLGIVPVDETIYGTSGGDRITGTDTDDIIDGLGGDDSIRGEAGNDTLYGGSGDDSVEGNEGDDTIYGGDGDDFIRGGDGSDTIYGGSGENFLYGNDGDDTFISDSGEDYMRGGSGNDTYIISMVGGLNTVNEIGSEFGEINRIELSDVNPQDVEFTRVENSNDLLLVNENTSAQVLIPGWFIGAAGPNGETSYSISEIQFADGTVYDVAGIMSALGDTPTRSEFIGESGQDYIEGSEMSDYISGLGGNDVLLGLGGDDEIHGGKGSDNLIGGAGDDALHGGRGNDLYEFNVGDGHDVILDEKGKDTISFSPSVTSDKVSIKRTVNADNVEVLLIEYGNNDSITVHDWKNSSVNTIRFADGTELTAADINTQYLLELTENDDTFIDDNGSSFIDGLAGNDQILGMKGNDTIVGGLGNDRLDGGEGRDTYIFSVGDGHDVISDAKGKDTIVFSDGIVAESVAITRFLDSAGIETLVLNYGESDSITIENWAVNPIENITFADGTELTHSDINRTIPLQLSDDADFFVHDNSGEIIDAMAGDDHIEALGGNDTLIGGTGNDRLAGGEGSDQYIFNVGDGQDVIFDIKGNDTIVFGESVSSETVTLTRFIDTSGMETLLLNYGEEDSITIENWAVNPVEKVQFADGTEWSRASINASAPLQLSESDDHYADDDTSETIHALAGDDHIEAFGGNDVLVGGTGNDRLDGGRGRDSYLFSLGDGQDVITDEKGKDSIVFNDGIMPGNVSVERFINDLGVETLRLSYGVDDSITVESWATNPIEKVQFADGTEWTNRDINASVPLVLSDTNDHYVNDGASETIYAMAGDDHVEAMAGNDTLVGGIGNDRLEGGNGRDTYIFNIGDGQDVIVDTKGKDTIVFNEGISVESVSAVRFINDAGVETLLVNYGPGDDITIEDWATNPIETIQFADGTEWSSGDINSATSLDLSEAADHYVDDRASETIHGLAGDDHIEAMGGNDTLVGGTGNDRLEGGEGRDTYHFNVGDGQDVIADAKGKDSIVFGSGITSDSVLVTRFLNDAGAETLQLNYGDSDVITIENWATNPIESVQFADGTEWTNRTINQSVPLSHSESTQETDYETISSATTQVFSERDGHSVIASDNLSETISFDQGITADTVSISGFVDKDGVKSLILTYGQGATITIEDWDANALADVQFTDGTRWSRIYMEMSTSFKPPRGEYTVIEESGVDTIAFGAGISTDSVSISGRVDESGVKSLIINYGEEATISIDDWETSSVQQLQFADGTRWNRLFLEMSTGFRPPSGEYAIDESYERYGPSDLDADMLYQELKDAVAPLGAIEELGQAHVTGSIDTLSQAELNMELLTEMMADSLSAQHESDNGELSDDSHTTSSKKSVLLISETSF